MKKFNKKIVSAIAALALSASAFAGVAAITGCSGYKDEHFGQNNGVTQVSVGKTKYTYSSVFGTREATAERTIYVSPDGTGDGSESSPASISSVLSGNDASVKAGDLVVLKDGVYEFNGGFSITKSGTYDKPITIIAENTGKATLSFYKMGGGVGLYIDGNFVNFIGINECGAGSNGIRIRGSYNLLENVDAYDNRDTGIQIARKSGNTIDTWPNYNLIKNCSSHNNYDFNVGGENADGFAAKLSIGYGNVFDGCIAYRNSDDGWDLYARRSEGNIGTVYIYNSVAFENGYLEYTHNECRARYDANYVATDAGNTYKTSDGDGNGFKLGGEAMEGDVFVYNCLSFANLQHGFTDNSNPGYISVKNCTAVDNGAGVDNDPASENFGKINGIAKAQSNIDLSRAPISYNHLDHSLSIRSDMVVGLDSDYFRGSAEDNILFLDEGDATGGKATNVTISGKLDADTRNGITGVQKGSLLSPSEIFEKVNATLTEEDGVKTLTTNVTGHEGRVTGVDGSKGVHSALRNADGSVNMGDYFKIKDQSKLLGVDNPIGADLTKTSYEDYKHYDTTDFSSYGSDVAVRLQSTSDMLYLQTDEAAVYQDFNVVTRINGCMVTWQSDHPEIIKVGKDYLTSVSNTEFIPIEVHRPETDTEVKLTATVHYFGATVTREFVLNVIGDSPAFGEITVIGPSGAPITDGDSIIVDKYTALADPAITVLNAADYNGKAIDASQADFETTYEYGDDIGALNNGNSRVVNGFTTSQDGAFKITMKVTLTRGANRGQSTQFVYYVLVASNTAKIEFLDGKHTVVVNSQGYNLSGDLTSAIGTVYSLTSPTQLESVTAEQVKEQGLSESFRATRVSFDFANANLSEYYIYTVFANGNGELTSEVYEDKINVKNISTKDDFYKLAQRPMDTTAEEAASTIYALTCDLDFTDYNYTMVNSNTYDPMKEGFKGFFNGNGHTISNITIASTGMQYTGIFRSLAGGTVTNVKFDNINVSGEQEKLGGIFGTIYYGNVSYLNITNLTVLGAGDQTFARVGGLAGAITSDNMPVRIDHISIVNNTAPEEDGSYKVQIGGDKVSQRIGALAGYIQTGSADRHMDIIISDCYTKAILKTGGNGGIGGMIDARNVEDDIRFINCYSECVLSGGSGSAAILGANNALNGKYYIINCAGIVTNFANGNKVYNTYTNADATAYNNAWQGTASTADAFKLAETFTALGFDLENDWVLDETNGGITLKFTVAE